LEFIPSTFPSRGKSGLPSTPTSVNVFIKKHTVATATVCFFIVLFVALRFVAGFGRAFCLWCFYKRW
jgi:hypothetical protein